MYLILHYLFYRNFTNVLYFLIIFKKLLHTFCHFHELYSYCTINLGLKNVTFKNCIKHDNLT